MEDYTPKMPNCMLRELLQSREQKVLLQQEIMLQKNKRHSSGILRTTQEEHCQESRHKALVQQLELEHDPKGVRFELHRRQGRSVGGTWVAPPPEFGHRRGCSTGLVPAVSRKGAAARLGRRRSLSPEQERELCDLCPLRWSRATPARMTRTPMTET